MEPVHAIAAAVGFASMGLLWLALMAGLALARGWTMTRVRHSTLLAVHMSLALIGLSLGVVHGVAQIVAPAQTVKIIDTFVPFTNAFDPIGIGLGVAGIEVMISLVISVWIQKLLGFHRWRALHATAYAAYTLVTGHVLISGSEVEGWAIQSAVLGPWLLLMGLWLVGGTTSARQSADPLELEAASLAVADRTAAVRNRPTTVQVNPQKCARFGFCEQEAPEVFRLRGDGHLLYHSVVSEQHLESAQRAARACPARAILLSQAGGDSSGPRLGPAGAVGPTAPPLPTSGGPRMPTSGPPVSASGPPIPTSPGRGPVGYPEMVGPNGSAGGGIPRQWPPDSARSRNGRR